MFNQLILNKMNSKVSKKTWKVAKAIKKVAKAIKRLMVAILDEPKVKEVLGIALIAYLIIGGIGMVWLGASIFFLFFGTYGIAYWLRDFAVACPWIAFIWLLIGVSSLFMWTMKKEPKKQQATQNAEINA